MKVAFVSTLYHPHAIGGAEVTVRLLAEGLVRAGHGATVISLSPDGRRWDGEVAGVRTHYLPLANLYWPFDPAPRGNLAKLAWHLIDGYNPVMGRRVASLLAAERPDVVHVHNLLGFSAAVWRAAGRLGLPVVQTLHDYYLGCPRGTMYRDGRNCAAQCADCRVLTRARRGLSAQLRAVTGVSRRMLGRLEATGLFAGVPRRAVIQGCNFEAPPPARRPRPDGAPLRLGYFGRVEPIKGVELLLDAMAGLPPERFRLRIGGRGPAAFMERLGARPDAAAVEFLGFVRPEEFFAGIDYLVVPSLWEDPLPRVVHEAFSFGVPVVGAAVGGIPEMVTPGRTGFLFPAGDAGALRDALAGLPADPAGLAALSDGCLARAGDFDFDRIFALYREVLEGAAPGGTPEAAPQAGTLALARHAER
ncbi:MAG: glycosyltransferase family 4 protein [Dongiaceae bacterium]